MCLRVMAFILIPYSVRAHRKACPQRHAYSRKISPHSEEAWGGACLTAGFRGLNTSLLSSGFFAAFSRRWDGEPSDLDDAVNSRETRKADTYKHPDSAIRQTGPQPLLLPVSSAHCSQPPCRDSTHWSMLLGFWLLPRLHHHHSLLNTSSQNLPCQ